MKNRTITIALLLSVVLAAFVLMLSCGTGPQNTIQNSSQNQSLGNAESSNSALLAADSSCDETDLQKKITDIKSQILKKMNNDLKMQHNGNSAAGLPPRFEYDVRKSLKGNYIEVYFENGVSGVDGLKDVADILNDFKKDKCVLQVYFVKKGGIPAPGQALVADSFEWTACEWPKVACPNGVCGPEGCPSLSPEPTNTNGNTNTNVNR